MLLTDGERRIRLQSLVADLEGLRREAKNVGADSLAFMIDLALDEAQTQLGRLGPTNHQ